MTRISRTFHSRKNGCYLLQAPNHSFYAPRISAYSGEFAFGMVIANRAARGVGVRRAAQKCASNFISPVPGEWGGTYSGRNPAGGSAFVVRGQPPTLGGGRPLRKRSKGGTNTYGLASVQAVSGRRPILRGADRRPKRDTLQGHYSTGNLQGSGARN